MKAQELQKKTMVELTAIYNKQTGAAIKAFSSKRLATNRIMEAAKMQAEIDKDKADKKSGKGKGKVDKSTNGKAATKVKDKKVKTLETTSNRSVRQVSEELILEDSPALTYEQIVLKVKEELSNSSTTVACMRWYATQMRERDEQVPDRPRKPKGVTLLS